MQGALSWAKQFFGTLEVAALLRKRVVSMAASAMESPDGTITQTFDTHAQREGAYRALSNPALTQATLVRSIAAGTAQRVKAQRVVIVPVDPSSLSITDTKRARGTGRVGSDKTPSRGFHVISAIVVIAGVVAGLIAQQFWIRPDNAKRTHRDRTPFRNKETARWCDVLDSVLAVLRTHAPDCRPWFQLDRGGDIQHVLRHAIEQNCLITVRSLHNRKMLDGELLHSMIRREKACGTMLRTIRMTGGRTRQVEFVLRFKRVSLRFRDRLGQHKPSVMELNVVHALELGTPVREKRIEWFLLTTQAVNNESDAMMVLEAYTQRFQIELMHHGWKSGRCNVERTQLRTAEAMQKWATIMAAVATEALFLTHQSRETPEAPATEYLSRAQIDATIVLCQPKGWEPGQTPPLALVVRWIAQLGGFVTSNSGPPGKVTIGRGLEKVNIAVFALANARAMRKQKRKIVSKKSG